MAKVTTKTETEESRTSDGIFRQTSLDRVSGPEELNDYIRVTTPSVWIVLTSLVVLLLGMLAWSIFGTVDKQNGKGGTEEIHPITYVTNGEGTDPSVNNAGTQTGQ